MKQYWAIVNHPKSLPLAIKMTELKKEIMETIIKNPDLSSVIGIPIYFSPGLSPSLGVWPKPDVNCIIVTQVKEEEI